MDRADTRSPPDHLITGIPITDPMNIGYRLPAYVILQNPLRVVRPDYSAAAPFHGLAYR